jgi:hypothetical protein
MFLPIETLLFHGTSVHNAERILRSSRLAAGARLPEHVLPLLPNPPGSLRGPVEPNTGHLVADPTRVCSLSRNLSSARSHAAQWKDIAGAVLAFDREAMRIALGRRLFSYNDILAREGISRSSLNEAEEVVFGDITNIGRFVRYVIVFKYRNGSVEALLTGFPCVARHPNLLVVKDYRNRALDHCPKKTFDRYMLNIMLSRINAHPSLRRSRRFGSRAMSIAILSAMVKGR